MRSRICKHTVAFLRGSVESLHYYIYALGKGSRKIHFLQLLRLPTTKKLIGWRHYADTQHARDDLDAGIQVTSGGDFSRIFPQVQAPSQKTNGTLECMSPLEQEP